MQRLNQANTILVKKQEQMRKESQHNHFNQMQLTVLQDEINILKNHHKSELDTYRTENFALKDQLKQKQVDLEAIEAFVIKEKKQWDTVMCNRAI